MCHHHAGLRCPGGGLARAKETLNRPGVASACICGSGLDKCHSSNSARTVHPMSAVAEDSPEPEPKSWRYSDGLGSTVDTGSYNRGIILDLDVKGEPVSITIGCATSEFDEFLPKAKKVLDTVKWEGA